jgi:bile acid:Na+ symporter, BASS family
MNLDSVKLNFNQDSIWILNVCLALVMLGIALDLKVDDFKRIVKTPKASVVGLLSQFVLLPALTFLLIVVIEPAPSIALGMIMVAACPGGNISNFLTHFAKGNTALSVTLTAFGTVIAIVMTPLNLQLWASLYSPTATLLHDVSLNAWDVLKALVILAGIPLLAGMLCRHYKPDFAASLANKMKPVSLFIFVVFLIAAIANNANHFMNSVGTVFFIVLVHNGIALITGFYFAKFSGLDFKDQKSIAIETGIQNSGLGLVLIFTFFNGLGGMAIIAAWWGIWHIISGLAIAFYWSRADLATQSAPQ